MPGPDEANIGRVAALRLGCGERVTAWTVQRNCASGMQALDCASQSIAYGKANLVLAGGVESMSRAPFVVPKAETAYPTQANLESTTLGWRLVNPLMEELGHTDALGVTAENVAGLRLESGAVYEGGNTGTPKSRWPIDLDAIDGWVGATGEVHLDKDAWVAGSVVSVSGPPNQALSPSTRRHSTVPA